VDEPNKIEKPFQRSFAVPLRRQVQQLVPKLESGSLKAAAFCSTDLRSALLCPCFQIITELLRKITMRRTMRLCAIAAATLAAQFPVLAQPLGSSSSGHQIAMTICGSCHEIFAPMLSRTEFPPSFEDIANLPSTTALSLKAFLRSNHNQMPNLIFSDAEADDVIAFILSLKRK
jgi:mono/diheme cytochrome c family protein